eukprot:3374400-Prymnesium_polylepis.1
MAATGGRCSTRAAAPSQADGQAATAFAAGSSGVMAASRTPERTPRAHPDRRLRALARASCRTTRCARAAAVHAAPTTCAPAAASCSVSAARNSPPLRRRTARRAAAAAASMPAHRSPSHPVAGGQAAAAV